MPLTLFSPDAVRLPPQPRGGRAAPGLWWEVLGWFCGIPTKGARVFAELGVQGPRCDGSLLHKPLARGPSCRHRTQRRMVRQLCSLSPPLLHQIFDFVRHIRFMGFNYSSFLNPYNDTWQEKGKLEPRRQKSCNVF